MSYGLAVMINPMPPWRKIRRLYRVMCFRMSIFPEGIKSRGQTLFVI